MSDPAELSSAFQERLEAFERELPGMQEGNVGALHRARVASRRLRELVPLLPLDRTAKRKLGVGLKKTTRALGFVRELDVLGLLIDEFRRDGRCPVGALNEVGGRVAEARDETRERLIGKRRMAKLSKLVARLRRASETLKTVTPSGRRSAASGSPRARRWALDARLASRAARVRAAFEHAGSVYASGQLHDVRIALKKLRYAIELTDDSSGRLSADVAALKGAQDLLGRLHDFEVLLSWTRDAQASLSPPDLTMWRALDAMEGAIEDDCRRLHARAMRDRQKLMTLTNRLGGGGLADQPRRRAATG